MTANRNAPAGTGAQVADEARRCRKRTGGAVTGVQVFQPFGGESRTIISTRTGALSWNL